MGVVAIIEQIGVLGRGHGAIEPRQHHGAARQAVDGVQQPGGGGDRAGGAGGNHRAVAIDEFGRLRLAVEALTAEAGDVVALAALQMRRPVAQRDIEKGQRLLPIGAQIGLDLGHDGADIVGAALFGEQIIDQLPQRFGHGEDFPGGGGRRKGLPAGCGFGPGGDQFGELEPTLEGAGGGQRGGQVKGRQERLFILGLAAKGADVGQKAKAQPAKFIGQRQPGAPRRHHDGHIGQPERVGAVGPAEERAIDDAGGERGDEPGVRGDGKQGHGASCLSAAASPSASPTWNQGALRATP